MDDKDVCLQALGVWAYATKLSFPDALAACYSQIKGYALATFDRDLETTPGVIRYAW